MSKLRDQLGHARQAYERKRYPGDLAADIFARLDAGEPLDGARSQDAGADVDVSSSPIRPADVDAVRGRWWRPLLAIAAVVAVVATSVVTLRMTDSPRPGTGGVATTSDPQTPVAPSKTDPTPAVDPTSEFLAAATTDDEATDVAADFSVVPAYQSFAIGVPTSISLASLEEYERQAQEQQQQSTSDGTSTVQ